MSKLLVAAMSGRLMELKAEDENILTELVSLRPEDSHRAHDLARRLVEVADQTDAVERALIEWERQPGPGREAQA